MTTTAADAAVTIQCLNARASDAGTATAATTATTTPKAISRLLWRAVCDGAAVNGTTPIPLKMFSFCVDYVSTIVPADVGASVSGCYYALAPTPDGTLVGAMVLLDAAADADVACTLSGGRPETLVAGAEAVDVYLLELGVRADWRRRGVARQLVGEAVRRMAACGRRTLGLVTHAANADARAAYERMGFVQSGDVARDYYGADGQDGVAYILTTTVP